MAAKAMQFLVTVKELVEAPGGYCRKLKAPLSWAGPSVLHRPHNVICQNRQVAPRVFRLGCELLEFIGRQLRKGANNLR